MKRSFASSGVANTLSFVRDAILSTSGDGGPILKVSSWKDVLRLTHSVGLTLLGAGTIGALLLLRQVSPGAALSWILQARPPHDSPDPSSLDASHLTIPGLRNTGNNCFLNAILQALASSAVLLSFLAAYDRERILSLFHGVESRCTSLPLTEALSDLLIELCELDPEPRVASPYHVMHALEPYAKQFDLSLQQDAAEALTYLMTALHEERLAFFETFRAYRESICDASRTCIDGGFPSGMVIDNASNRESSPLHSWKNQLHWPMEGTIGSMLTCKKCGFQFSTQFQSFHDVPLSPPRLPDGNIVSGCSLEACLQQFTAPERMTNVKCSHCSHSLAVNFLQLKDGLDQAVLQRVKDCTFDDDCSCEELVTQAGGLWRNIYVNAVKQLRFGCCPEVMCCQVQRAVVSKSGELMKWTGHVSFPLILDLSPYVMSTRGYSMAAVDGSLGKFSDESSGHTEVLQKFLAQRRSFETRSNVECDNCQAPSSTDGSSSDDTHLSGSEDLASDTSSESTSGRSGDETGVGKHEGSELPRWDGPFDLHGSRDVKMYGLDSAVFASLSQNLLPIDDRELLPRCRELGDGASLCEPSAPMASNPILSFPMPQSRSEKVSTDIAGASGQNEKKMCEVAQNGHCNSGRWVYELISVVVHHGSPRNGHYTVYRKVKVKIDNRTEEEYESDMHQDMDVTNSDSCKSDAMDMDNANLSGCDDKIGNARQDPSSEVVLAEEGYGSGGMAWSSNRDEVDFTKQESSLAGAEQLSCNNLPELLTVDSDKVVEGGGQGVVDGGMEASSCDLVSKKSDQEKVVLWFRVSDSYVDSVAEEEVRNAEATLLFYEKVH